jgi:glyoxylase-like metal-dependent hydrolase (beta-lactamase superfamily II)
MFGRCHQPLKYSPPAHSRLDFGSMQPSEVAPGVVRVTVPLPFRPRTVNAYLVDHGGGRITLVDGGAGTAEGWDALDGAVRSIAGGWRAIALQVVTHMHVDHIGLVGRVRGACGAPVAMGRLDAERVAHAARYPEEEASYRGRTLRQAGADAALIAWATAPRGSPGRAGAADPPPCDIPLPEPGGPVPGMEGWEAVWTPGHTAGHIALFRPRDAVMIAGDAVLPRISPTIGVNRQREDPVGDYLAALDRIAGLAPSTVLPGHGDTIIAPAARVRELREGTLEESARVRGLLGDGPRTVAAVVAARYAGRDLPEPVMVQAIRETRAHLDHLVAAGRARAEPGPDTVRFWHL